jgi:hypothetical protein
MRIFLTGLAGAAMTAVAACGGTAALPTAARQPKHPQEPARHSELTPGASGPKLHVERHPAKHALATSTTVPGAPGCPMFPANNIWNTDISKLPVDRHSAAWMRSMDSARTFLHPDFGPSGGYPYGIPYTIVTSKHRLVRIAFKYASESDRGPYPFGPGTPIEGGKNAGGDRHAIMVNKKTCVLYELFDARYSKHPTAGSGAIWNLRSNALRPAGWTSADAAGLPILPGLLSYQQVASSARTGKPITHAIRFTAQVTRTRYIWPARHEAGSSNNPALPPMGARFRLKASFNIAGYCRNSRPYCKDAKAVLTEMKNYGLILADNGSNWYFGGAAFPQWPDALVSLLKRIPARAFQAVNTSCLMVSPKSGEVRAKRGCPIG